MRVEKLAKTHDRATFRCGLSELDARYGFIRLEAERTRPALAAGIEDPRTTLGGQ